MRMQLDRWWHRFAVILRMKRKRDRTQHVAVLLTVIASNSFIFSTIFFSLNYILAHLSLTSELYPVYVTQKLLDVIL